jgi:ferritin-like metal-binding protein YciE
MKLNSLEKVLHDQLKDLYSAETQLVKALPKMARHASSEQLRHAFESHLEETRQHVERLQSIGETLGVKVAGKKCKGMEGLIEEGKEILDAEGEEAVLDAALIAAAQRVEHYEIASYGTACALAEQLGDERTARLLQRTLDEESAADDKLTQIAMLDVYPQVTTVTAEGSPA